VIINGIDDGQSLAAGSYHTCVIRKPGKLRCWGNNDEGQLGDGTTKSRQHAVAVPAKVAEADKKKMPPHYSGDFWLLLYPSLLIGALVFSLRGRIKSPAPPLKELLLSALLGLLAVTIQLIHYFIMNQRITESLRAGADQQEELEQSIAKLIQTTVSLDLRFSWYLGLIGCLLASTVSVVAILRPLDRETPVIPDR